MKLVLYRRTFLGINSQARLKLDFAQMACKRASDPAIAKPALRWRVLKVWEGTCTESTIKRVQDRMYYIECKLHMDKKSIDQGVNQLIRKFIELSKQTLVIKAYSFDAFLNPGSGCS